MEFPKIAFKIIKNKDCPKYSFGDVMHLGGLSIAVKRNNKNSLITTTVVHPPDDKDICDVLCCDLTKIIMHYNRSDNIPVCMVTCSGCNGSVTLEHSDKVNEELIDDPPAKDDNFTELVPVVQEFPFYQHINRSIEEVLSFFQLRSYKKDDIILRKNDPGRNLYIMVSGAVDIFNKAGIPFAELGSGDVFGEMSLFSDESVSATVHAKEPVEVLFVNGADFNTIMHRNSRLHLFFTRLLADRLKQSNILRSDDYASGMIGRLAEIPPEALFQTLHVNNKTGILTVNEIPRGTARFSIRQGALIKGYYGNLKDEEAFYAILKEKKGRFRFVPGLPDEDLNIPEIGYFMKLLMEGLRRMDEERSKTRQKE